MDPQALKMDSAYVNHIPGILSFSLFKLIRFQMSGRHIPRFVSAVYVSDTRFCVEHWDQQLSQPRAPNGSYPTQLSI